MFKFLIILIFLIIKTHSWTWKDYPSPRGTTYWKCGVLKPTYVCDPDGVLTDQQRKEIVDLVEDFKEKTKRPNSKDPCMREGLRLIVALATDRIGIVNGSSVLTQLCHKNWTSSGRKVSVCDSVVHGIELNTDNIRYCYSSRWVMILGEEEYEKLGKAEKYQLTNKNYFYALKSYINNLRMLYINRFSIFDDYASNEENITLLQLHLSLQDTNRKLSELQQIQGKMFIGKNITTTSSKFIVIFSNNLLGLISIIISLIIGMVLFYRMRQFENYFTQRNTSKTEIQLMTPLQPVEIVEKRRENEGSEEATKPLLKD
ncbi:unnamed protein product [Meloidogyne enterolobii]|uniref:Uncharacterized protein n=1 Tax=Meloidogyne enterolobii TaxID=390850 RepID=A0ACB1A415_MELEN